MSAGDVDQGVQDLWRSRPRRRSGDRKVAGVAAGIARRYGLDPVLVRVVFVVAAVNGGAGLLLYLLGWLLLPVDGDEVSAAEGLAGRGRSSVSRSLAVVLVLALFPVSAAVLDGASGVVALALGGGALFLLHRNRSGAGEHPATAATPPVATHGVAAPAPVPAGDGRAVPPAWDPLGAAPFAWDLPEPAPAPAQAPPRRRRSVVAPLTLGLALLSAGAAAAFVPAANPAQVAGVALGVVGLGLVAGSVVHRGRGLLVVAVPLALATWGLQALPDGAATVGERRWSASTAAELAPRYSLGIGDAELDLTDLELADGRTARTSVDLGLGEARVLLPRDLDVELRCEVPVGAVDCLGRSQSGGGSAVELVDTGTGSGGGTLVLDVRADTGHVLVTRG